MTMMWRGFDKNLLKKPETPVNFRQINKIVAKEGKNAMIETVKNNIHENYKINEKIKLDVIFGKPSNIQPKIPFSQIINNHFGVEGAIEHEARVKRIQESRLGHRKIIKTTKAFDAYCKTVMNKESIPDNKEPFKLNKFKKVPPRI